MEAITVFKCDYCKKTYANKYACKKHEEVCFFNEATKSCATCIFFSGVHFQSYPLYCLLGEFQVNQEDDRQKFRTRCGKWRSSELIDDLELSENKDGIMDRLFSGDPKIFEALTELEKLDDEFNKGRN